MTGGRVRRPPRLDDPAPRKSQSRERPGPPEPPSPARRMVRAGVTGTSTAMDAATIERSVRAVADGARAPLFGLTPFEGATPGEVRAAAAAAFGWPGADASTRIDPARTLAGAEEAARRIAVGGGASATGEARRVAFATARPASLLPLLQAIAASARHHGATVLVDDESGEVRADGRAGRRLRWVGHVAVVTDGMALLPTDGVEAGDELLFHLPRPDLVVADRGFAGVALSRGIEVVAFCDLDGGALALAAARGLPVTIVPLDASRPPAAYEPLAGVITHTMDQFHH